MEVQLNDLVSAIKRDGIDAANKEAEAITAAAQSRADEIIKEAEKKASELMNSAKEEAEGYTARAKEDAEQARRDAMLSFKANVRAEFEKLLSADIKKQMNGPALVKLIAAALHGEDPSKYTAEISDVSDALKAEMAGLLHEGLAISPSKRAHGGFRLAANDGSGYFDCTDDEIMKMLMPFFKGLD